MKNLLLPSVLLLLFIVIFSGSILLQFSKNPKIPVPQGLKPSPTAVPTQPLLSSKNLGNLTLKKIAQLTTEGSFTDLAISSDQKFIFAANPSEDALYQINIQSGKVENKIPIPCPLAPIPYNQNLLVVQKNSLTILSANHEVKKSVSLSFEPAVSFITSDQKYLLIADGQNNSLSVYNAKTLEPVSIVPLEAKPTSLFENNDLVFISFANDLRLGIFSLSSLKMVSFLNLKFNPKKLAFVGDFNKFLVTDADGLSLWIFRSVKDKTPKRIKLNDAPFDLYKIPQSDFYLILGQHGSVFLFDAKAERVVKTFTIQSSLLSEDTWAKILFIPSPTPKVFLLSTDGKKLQTFSLSPNT